MLGHTKTRHIKNDLISLSYQGVSYLVPEKILRPYKQETLPLSNAIPARNVFADMERTQTKSGALLKGLRYRENMTQVQFAQKIGITQANLSSMENGRRAIGKEIAKRIQAIFKVDYRYFLE